MKRRAGYLLQRIADKYYVLPYGQLIADHKRGISLNSTGVYVWNLLEKEMSREELKTKYLEHFLNEPSQKDMLSNDLDGFLNQLIECRIIEDDVSAGVHAVGPCTYLEIAGLVLEVYGAKALIETSSLKDFCSGSQTRAHQRISVFWTAPDFSAGGTVLVRNPELTVCERETGYQLIFPTFSEIYEVDLSKDGKDVFFYCKPPFTDELGIQFFHALRHVFLYLAQKHGMYAIHSASILYKGKAWLFSASSGTGKSTHTNLWKDLYGTEILNGDLNLLTLDGSCAVIHGIPWCGTSGIFDKRTVPLGGIVLLKQAAEDCVEELSPDKKTLLVMQRFISPIWTDTQLKDSVRFSEHLSERISVCRLRCTKNESAAELIKNRIDNEV